MRTTSLAVAALAVVATLALAAPAASAVPPPATPIIKQRLAGADRFATAVAVSKSAYPTTAPVVYLTNGVNFPDALSAGPAAASQGGPVLLTKSDQVPDVIRDEIIRLAPQKIVLVGGTTALAPNVEKAMKALAPTVVRIAGADRYATSRALAEATFKARAVFIASGKDFPDALSAGAIAGKSDGPVLLVDGNASRFNAATAATLRKLQPTIVIVVGGTAAVSDGLLNHAKELAPGAQRVTGSDRFDTSANIGRWFPSTTHAYVASGVNFPDALVGSALAGKNGEPLYIIEGGCQPDVISSSQGAIGVKELTIIGGTSSVADGATNTPCWIHGTFLP